LAQPSSKATDSYDKEGSNETPAVRSGRRARRGGARHPIDGTCHHPGRNGAIVFGADTGSGSQLYTVRPNGHGLRQITRVDGDAVHPDWSPDGRRIVFELDHPSGPPGCSVELMNADGTGLVDLTGERNGCENQPSFTPDGRRVVFVHYDDITNVESIWSMNLSGGDRKEITRGTGTGVTDPNVSPDGRTVSFVDYNGQELGQALYTVRMDGSHLTRLTSFETDVAVKQDWSPDGWRIVFTDNADNFAKPANVATIRPDGTGLRYLTDYRTPGLRAYTGSYSPDGNWVVFRLEDHGRYGLYRMSAGGGAGHPILRLSSLKPRFIDWGPAAS
jgi:Tol biopolymer transport system component